jgi:hypothetical protein
MPVCMLCCLHGADLAAPCDPEDSVDASSSGRQLITLPPGRLTWTPELHDRWAPLPRLVVVR